MGMDRCLCVYMCVLVCKYIYMCVCVHCLESSDRYLCVTDYNNIQFGRLCVFPASSTDAQHPPEVAWVVVHDAAARGMACISQTFSHTEVALVTWMCGRGGSQLTSLGHFSLYTTLNCLNYETVMIMEL